MSNVIPKQNRDVEILNAQVVADRVPFYVKIVFEHGNSNRLNLYVEYVSESQYPPTKNENKSCLMK